MNNLTPGSHTLTLTAVDSQGISGSASVNVTIGLGIYLPAVTR